MKPEACTGGCLHVERELHLLGRLGDCTKTIVSTNCVHNAGKPEKNTVRIGVHVRAEHDADAPEHFFCLDSLLDKYRQEGKQVKVLLVTASVSLQNNALQRYKDILMLPNGLPDGIVAVHDRDDSHTDKSQNVTKEGGVCKLYPAKLLERGKRLCIL